MLFGPVAILAFLLPVYAHASWHYNENGGFGIYEPTGWTDSVNGRSSQLTGPEHDTAQSSFFLGSDWQSSVQTLDDLKKFALEDSGATTATPITISELHGFRTGTALHGNYYVLRIATNVIEISYDIKGSKAQREEANTMLSSIEIRTKGNEYP
jgi:hypothetical protein